MKKGLRILGILLRETFWIALAVLCLFGGYKGFQYLGDNREIVAVTPAERPIALVETAAFDAFQGPLPIRSQGFVQPRRTVSLSSPVGGRVSSLHPAVVNLGQFSAGDILVQLDDQIERASLKRTEFDIEAAVSRLELVQSRLERTRTLRQSGVASQQSLDQLLAEETELKANINALNAAWESATLAIQNKQIVAPFDGSILEKLEEIGSVIGAGQAVGQVFTQDQMTVDVPVREAEALLIPGLFDGAPGRASVEVSFGGQMFVYNGTIDRVDPALDTATRTVRLTIALADLDIPYVKFNRASPSGTPPALINSFAKVVIDGAASGDVFAIPTTSLRNQNELWFFVGTEDDLGTLEVVDATPVYVDGETSFVRPENWPEGGRLITTTLPAAAPGMSLRDVSTVAMAANNFDG